MITNDQQYEFTRQRLEGFKQTLLMFNVPDNELKQKDPAKWQINIDVLQSFIENFTSQIQDYEVLVNHEASQPIAFDINSLQELPRVLIKTRITAKISQTELAEKIGISTKQLQRSEKLDYESATLTELLQVSEALGIQVNLGTVALAS